MEALRGKPQNGTWWEPDHPDDCYKGTLEIDENHHGKLMIRGTEEALGRLPVHGAWRNFFGKLNDRIEIALLNAGMERGPSRTFPKNPERETEATFYSNTILIGRHITSEEVPFLRAAYLRITGLRAWCDVTGFSGETKYSPTDMEIESADVAFRPVKSPHFDLGCGRTIRFVSEYEGPSFFGRHKEIQLSESNTIELTFPEPISLRQLDAEISIWQSLVTFSLRRPTYRDEVSIAAKPGERWNRCALVSPGRRADKAEGELEPRSLLLSQSKLGTNIAAYLKAWREIHDDIEMAVLLLTGTEYQGGQFNHAKLLNHLQALEILHREAFKLDRFPDRKTRNAVIDQLRAAVPKTLNEALQRELKDQLGYIGSLTLLDRLKHLYSLYPKSLSPLFRNGDVDMVLLKNVRNFLTHYGDQKTFGKKFLWSRDIHVLKEKARLFLEVCVLGLMGMSDDEVVAIMSSFGPYLDWRLETSMEFANEMLRKAENKGV